MASVSPSNGMREGASLELALATVKVCHARVPLCNVVFVSVTNTASVHTDITWRSWFERTRPTVCGYRKFLLLP